MDTSRAKNILIFVFVCLNLLLAYQLFSPNPGLFGLAVAPEEHYRMEDRLNEGNYKLEASLPVSLPRVSFLMVRPQPLDYLTLKNRLVGEHAVSSFTPERIIYESDEGTLEVYSDGFLRFRAEKRHQEKTILKENEALVLAEAFLEGKGLKQRPVQLDIISEYYPGGYVITYYQSYQDVPVFSSYFKVWVEWGIVSKVECYRVDPVEVEKDWEMEVITAAAAIVRLLEEIGPAYPLKTITGVDLGFFSMSYDAEQWEIPPVWRIVIDNRELYYVNAFSGNLEEQSNIYN